MKEALVRVVKKARNVLSVTFMGNAGSALPSNVRITTTITVTI